VGVTSSGFYPNLDTSLFIFFELDNIFTGQRFRNCGSYASFSQYLQVSTNKLSSFKLTFRVQETKSMGIAGLKIGQSSFLGPNGARRC